ncbi:MAG TPA: hypothetical protein PLP49_07250 [Anaerohalosphaeraceae bacterium]|mgnify:FL=1|nr:hypothetical protein [Anaerohalosphaeraceae bacterium]HPB93326.1 hypothetical protein [Anaerohalosphaeraceae bacterium]HRT24105.1 hypothetical protein [Anaerohalosphaeraceae bacterium]
MKRVMLAVFLAVIPAASRPAASNVPPPRHAENLGRGVVAVRTGSSQVYVGWRMLGTEWGQNIGYHVYRGDVRITSSPITTSTNFIDSTTANSTYRVSAVIDGIEGPLSEPAEVWSTFYNLIPLQRPADGVTPAGEVYTYSPGDCSVGDLTGDGEYEIVVKWDPSNAKDNAQSGYTGNVYLDAYKLDGTFLWRIDLGHNIRAGAHYTPFIVYDLDSDGIAEAACKTAPGTIDGQGNYVLLPGDNPHADYRESSGYILSGPEYLTIFNGQTGAAMATTPYVPPRGNVCNWGDCYGNRVDRFLAAVAYLDGERPSLVMCRGYYTRTALAAWDWRDGLLTQRWVFDTGHSGGLWAAYRGQGNHNLSVADADGDGFDEIIYGSCTIDHDGTGLYTTGLGHGDALHVSDMDPDRPGLEVWQCHESGAAGATFRDAATGEVIFTHYNDGDVGRACAAHIDSRYLGYQLWSYAAGGVYNTNNVQISGNQPAINFLAWWTGDLQREIVDVADGAGKNPKIDKWGGDGVYRVLSLYNYPFAYATNAINGTKGNPCLSADILGDWREELIYKTSDNEHLIIFTTTTVTSHRFYTLMHDSMYRTAVAWQNVGYNQPPHPSFYIGEGMAPPPTPNILLVDVSDPDETEPPIPNPMGWLRKPYVSGNGSIAMQAKTALDVNGVEYYFACTYGGGRDSGWQDRPAYEDTGLTPGQEYTYTVKARDKSNNQNETLASVPASCIAEHITTGVVYWDFEDGIEGLPLSSMPKGGSEDTISGIVMHGFDATYGPSFSSNTLTGSGLSIYCNGGQDGYVTDTALNSWAPQRWTIELSVNLLDISGFKTMIGRDGSSQNEREADFYLQKNGSNNKFRINFDTVGGRRWILDGDYVPAINKWYRLAVTSDGVTLKMYLDDGSDYKQIGSLDISAQSVADNAPAATNFNWTFGRGWYNGRFVDHINGWLDNIRFSETVLTPAQFLGAPSESTPWLYGDFTGNHFVDLDDFAVFTKLWTLIDCQLLSDFDTDGDCMIGLSEFSEMTDNWMMNK